VKIGVKVLPRKEVLDSQGRAVEKTLQQSGHKLSQCRVGKYIEIDVDEKDEQKALARATEMCEFVLYNPLTENYELEVIK